MIRREPEKHCHEYGPLCRVTALRFSKMRLPALIASSKRSCCAMVTRSSSVRSEPFCFTLMGSHCCIGKEPIGRSPTRNQSKKELLWIESNLNHQAVWEMNRSPHSPCL